MKSLKQGNARRCCLTPVLLFALACSDADGGVAPGSMASGADPVPASNAGTVEPNPPGGTDSGRPVTSQDFAVGPIYSAPARPHDSGRLTVSPLGSAAVASDPIGESVYVVPLDEGLGEPVEVRFEPGDEPGRAALDDDHAYVALPRRGGIAVVQLHPPALVGRYSVCPSPQGLALDGERLHVACRGGELQSLDAGTGEVLRELWLDDDLRDVLVWTDGLLVTRFLSAEVLRLDSDGQLVDRFSPPTRVGSEAALAWRTLPLDETRIVMVHQSDSDPESPGSYSGGPCGSLTTGTVTVLTVDMPAGLQARTTPDLATTPQWFPMLQRSSTGTVDAALVGDDLVLAYPGNAYALQWGLYQSTTTGATPTLASLQRHSMSSGFPSDCVSTGQNQDPPGVPLAVAGVPTGPLAGETLVLTETAKLMALDRGIEVTLHVEERRNTGLELFQLNVGAGVACASCHPTGRPDARVWRLPRGPRRTQSLEGGVSQRGAFHWDAEFEDFGSLVDDVMTRRMGLRHVTLDLNATLPDDAKAILLDFIDSIPAAPRSANGDAEAAARGEALFSDPEVACASCHPAPTYSDNRLHDVGTGGAFVTPSLLGVSARTPLMHDGCALDLMDRFGLCGGGELHGLTAHLSQGELDDLVQFMTTL